MKKKLLTVCLLLFLCGCATTNPRRQLYDANITLTHVANSLDVLIRAEKFDAGEVEAIKAIAGSASRLLDSWRKAINAGDTSMHYLDAFNILLEDLIKYEMEGNNGQE